MLAIDSFTMQAAEKLGDGSRMKLLKVYSVNGFINFEMQGTILFIISCIKSTDIENVSAVGLCIFPMYSM